MILAKIRIMLIVSGCSRIMDTSLPFKSPTSRRITSRSAATRAKLVSVAERLFAENGVEGVTLQQIGKTAGQSNAAVCQYHFSDKEGLLQSILDKHIPRIVRRRHALLDEIDRSGRQSLKEVVRAFIYPVAEKLLDPDGGEDFIRINAQLVATHTIFAQHLGSTHLHLPNQDRLANALHDAMAAHDLPEPVIQQRSMLAAVLLFHGLSEHIKIKRCTRSNSMDMETDVFIHTLEDGLLAFLSAPASPMSAAD